MAVAAPLSARLAAGSARGHSPAVPRVAVSACPGGTPSSPLLSSTPLLSRRSHACTAAARALPAAAPLIRCALPAAVRDEEAARLRETNARRCESESSVRAAVASRVSHAARGCDEGGVGGHGGERLSVAPLLPLASVAALLSVALPPSALALTPSALTPSAIAASLLPPLPTPLALPLSALPLAALDLAAWGDALDDVLFAAAHVSDRLVSLQLAALSPASVAVLFLAGVATSLTPCTLSVLPLTVGYIAGFQQAKPRALVAADAACFALGLAATRAGMGVAAALAGRAYGQTLGGAAGGEGGWRGCCRWWRGGGGGDGTQSAGAAASAPAVRVWRV
ncbi:hypothetical protein CLOM_g10899 [Closterium sp. NIES-68]|nr:hypothetical protein CLOM_g10899 [Closterium sp. NIES-68]